MAWLKGLPFVQRLLGLLDSMRFHVLRCPVCGARGGDAEIATPAYSAPYGPTESYTVEHVTCWTCGEAWDWRGVSDRSLLAAMERADQASVAMILDDLAAVGYSTGYLERVHGLKAGTLRSWRSGRCPPSGLALLRLVRGDETVVRDLNDLWQMGFSDRRGN